ncbi:MAG: DNA recombination protein RmuC [Pseudomonadota bacterium]|nr:DNA recombination protein RmuC [Pseudomonadota bacterium]
MNIIAAIFSIIAVQIIAIFYYQRIFKNQQNLQNQQTEQLITDVITEAITSNNTRFYEQILKQQGQTKSEILETLLQTLKHQHEQASTNHKNLSETVHNRLHDITKEVTQKLHSGFEKNNEVFHNVIKRLSLIDQAQEKITSLSENVVALQDILTDKSSRGAFGEVQLEQLIANIIPPEHYKLQEQLPNNKRVDCLLLMPQGSGHIAIDAKFPLENYQKQFDTDEITQKTAFTQFKADVKKHIDDISEKYIIPNFTAQGAMMFIPAEAVFAHIHAHHPDIIAYAHKKKVWITSPTTLMAVLNTALSVIKDYSTREQVDIIKQHLAYLAQDFERFDKRMEQLARHIGQANKDVDLIQKSSTKISQRFTKIENCELKSISSTENQLQKELID